MIICRLFLEGVKKDNFMSEKNKILRLNQELKDYKELLMELTNKSQSIVTNLKLRIKKKV